MNKNHFFLSLISFLIAGVLIAALVLNGEKSGAEQTGFNQTRVITPENRDSSGIDAADTTAASQAWGSSGMAKISLEDGQTLISVLNGNFDQDPIEEQCIAYRNLLEEGNPIYLAYVDDLPGGSYVQAWGAKISATQPGALSLTDLDLIGNHSVCIVVRGMDGNGQHTFTAFLKNDKGESGNEELFRKIADISIEGSISIDEVSRSQAYQLGQSNAPSFTIRAYGRDTASDNILDQIEIIYAYNQGRGQYEQSLLTRKPGSQVEQERVRALLSGGVNSFETFLSGMWYLVGDNGAIDGKQYIFFDPTIREIIFFTDGVWQDYIWESSNATRLGLYLSAQNVSVTTMRRQVDIELENLSSIKIRVNENLNLKVELGTTWNGSYRKAQTPVRSSSVPEQVESYRDATYASPWGSIVFQKDGMYTLYPGNASGGNEGRYIFYALDDYEILELRPGLNGLARETYLVADKPDEEGGKTLNRVGISASGLQDLHETPIDLREITEVVH